MNIRESIENNVVVWMLGVLLTGFLSGIGTYESALRIMKLEVVSEDRLKQLEELSIAPSSTNEFDPFSVPLPASLNASERDLIFSKVKEAFNERDTKKMYSLLGPVTRAQYSEGFVEKAVQPLFDMYGRINDGFYVNHQFLGKQGQFRTFMLNYSSTYENNLRGIVTVTVFDAGDSYQIAGIMMNVNPPPPQ